MPSEQVRVDRSKNQGMLVYFAVLGVAGAVIVILTVVRDWGFWGWFGGVLLLFTSIASVVSMAKTGGAGLARCPVCGHDNPARSRAPATSPMSPVWSCRS
jgi:hypothetical protein